MRKLPWIAQQNWEHVLFLHWPLPKHVVEPFIPYPFTLHTFNDRAWITIVSFQATGSKFRFMPGWTAIPPFTQINVRTYVKLRHTEEKGVYFFSLNANNVVGAKGAAFLFGLPFNFAQTIFSNDGHSLSVACKSKKKSDPFFSINYNEQNNTQKIKKNKQDKFLTEQYYILTVKDTTVIKIPLSHKKWELKDVKAELHVNEQRAEALDMIIPERLREKFINEQFIAHYSRFKQAKLHSYEKIAFIR